MDVNSLRKPGAAIVAALLGLAAIPGPALAVSPIDGGALLNVSPVTINDSAGDQYDPHVSGDLASYTDDADGSIHYYDFFTGGDSSVPTAPNSAGQLSDISNGRIAYARLDLSTFDIALELFDVGSNTTTEIDPDGTHRSNAGLGSDTVAFISDLNAQGELVATRVGASTSRITNDSRFDQQPQVSPSGDLIVWESCASTPANCDIHQAVWNGASWVVTVLTNSSDPEANPDTDGTNVVYDAERSGQRDICWQPVGGGTEQCLTLTGDQRNPAIRGGLVSFESVAAGDTAADLYVYQISTNRLFRITSTPGLDESLNDIDVLADGRVRVVWTSGTTPGRDVNGATFNLPPAGPTYSFGGFVAPVDGLPTLNAMKAGAAVPVTFGLGGDFGLGIFASGYPRSQTIACDATAPVDGVEQTVSAGASSLAYDPTTGLYTYVWKTDKAWAGTCRQLVIGFTDGSFARANFQFK